MKRYLHYFFNISNWKSFLYCSVPLLIVALIVFVNTIIVLPNQSKENDLVLDDSKDFLYKKKIEIKKKPYFPLVREFSLNSGIRKFDNENARAVGFELKEDVDLIQANNVTKVIYLATPYFTEWNPMHYYALHLGNTTFHRYACPVHNCHVTNDRAKIPQTDAALFHIRDLEVFSLPSFRSKEQTWILYSMEPPWLEIRDLSRFDGIFNWTMSYRRGSDVLVQYGFVGKKPHVVQKDVSMKKKQNRAVWLVSNCKTDSNREAYVKRLKEVYPVDVYGGCGKPACRPPETKKCYSKIARRYKFYLAFENSICQDYVTEKLFNSLEYPIIPIAFGGADYSSIVPEKSIINAMEFERPEDLGQFLWKLSNDDDEYKSYFEWKRNFRSYLQPWMCDLCEKLHQYTEPKVNWNLVDWWNEENTCRRWSNDEFLSVKKYEFPVYNTRLFN